MPNHYSRKDWGARPPEARYKLDPLKVDGVALHWPGIATPLSDPLGVMAALRSWQRLHMDTDAIAPGGASDIAYQVAIDNRGNWYQLRGLRHRSGANGDTDVNLRYGAFLLVLAQGEKPSDALVATVQERVARFRHIFPNGRRIVGHQDVRPEPTACPGPLVMDLIHRGRFEPDGKPVFVPGGPR